MTNPMIEITGLSKGYGRGQARARALSDVTIRVDRGEALALTGANGAGKSTLLRILATLLEPDSGVATIAGLDVVQHAPEVRESIGVVLQDVGLHPNATVRQVLTLHARLSGLGRAAAGRRVVEIIEFAGLADAANRRVGHLSGGMRRRVDLGVTLIREAPVLLLDEPTDNLDPFARRTFWEEFARLRDSGTTILLASQNVEETAYLADRVVTLAGGSLHDADDSPFSARTSTQDVTSGRLPALGPGEVTRHPPSWSAQVALLIRRVAADTIRNPVMALNLMLAVMFLLVYDGTVGGLPLFASFADGNYYNFILPAALLAASIGGASSGLLLVADIRSGYLDRQLTMPLRRSALVACFVMASALTVTLQACAVVAIAILFGAEPHADLIGLLGIATLTFCWGAGFAAYSVGVAVVSRDPLVTSAANLLFIPLIFMSPLLVPYEYLKPWMRYAADVNPTRYVMEGLRALLEGNWSPQGFAEALAASWVFGLSMGLIAVLAIRWRLAS